MAKRLLAWLMLIGLAGAVMGTGTALAGDENRPSGQCPITKRCPCGK